MMVAWYNEIDPFAVAWLNDLIINQRLPMGRVDERPIQALRPEHIEGEQAHFFAGIGGWPLALQLAGWPDGLPVWTGSCPCQPFSVAGLRRGTEDERHLWPIWFELIRERRPPVVFGEQVEGPAGRAWIDGVRADMEGVGYAVGVAVLPAASVGAPHIRHRIFWVADADGGISGDGDVQRGGRHLQQPENEAASGLADLQEIGRGSGRTGGEDGGALESCGRGEAVGLGNPDGERAGRDGGGGAGAETEGARERGGAWGIGDGARASGAARGVGDGDRDERRRERLCVQQGESRGEDVDARRASPLSAPWADLEWIPCSDGKTRPTQPGVHPLAHGVSGRVAVVRPRKQADAEVSETHWYSRGGAIRGFGNAIVPQVAATFIRAYLESRGLV